MARRPGTRLVTAAQVALGVGTVLAARPTARRIGGRRGAPGWLAPLIGVLGARQVAQAALVWTVDDPLLLRAGAAVDVLHAASMVPVAFDARYRGAALTSAALALASAAGGLAVADTHLVGTG